MTTTSPGIKHAVLALLAATSLTLAGCDGAVQADEGTNPPANGTAAAADPANAAADLHNQMAQTERADADHRQMMNGQSGQPEPKANMGQMNMGGCDQKSGSGCGGHDMGAMPKAGMPGMPKGGMPAMQKPGMGGMEHDMGGMPKMKASDPAPTPQPKAKADPNAASMPMSGDKKPHDM